jgi:hypothetical protein
MAAPKGPKTKEVTPAMLVQVAATAEAPRLIPLAQGEYVWYFDPINRKTLHLKTTRAEFAEALREACDLGLAPRIREELEGFREATDDYEVKVKWTDCIIDLEMAGVLS